MVLHLVGDSVDVAEVLAKDATFIGFSDLENEGGNPVRFGFLVEPIECGTKEAVLDGLVRVEAQNDVSLVISGYEIGEVSVLYGRKGMQIERNFAVKVIPPHIIGFVEFGDFEELVHVEPIHDPWEAYSYGVYQSRFEQEPPNRETYDDTEDYEEHRAVTRHDGRFLQDPICVSSVSRSLGIK